jgi:hypothetical protein
MMQSEREKLLHLEEELHKRVVGQDEAIKAVADAYAAPCRLAGSETSYRFVHLPRYDRYR